MSAAAQVSAIREHWPTALRVLQSIPAAVASKSLPRDCLFLNTLQAQLHSSKAVTFTPDYEVAGRPGFNFAPDARKVLVGEFKVPFHLAKAVACLLPVSFTFHMAIELLQCLGELLSKLEPGSPLDMRSTDQYSTPGNPLTIAAQLAASGLLQQLPAGLKQAQQQLQELEPLGWCGGPCHHCSTNKRTVAHRVVRDEVLLPSTAGLVDSSSAGRDPLQAQLLESCSKLVSFWPGGALSSAALGPSLVPMAQLALSSLQYTTQQAQQHEPGEDSCPPGRLHNLGRTALGACLALCAQLAIAAPAVPHHAQELVLHPAMLSAAVAIACAAIYGEHVADMADSQHQKESDSSSSSSTNPASSRTAIDEASSGDIVANSLRTYTSTMIQPHGTGPHANLPATAWQLLSAQEASLRPGQTLLPDLQQQLVDTLGCPGKGFLWLAPLWYIRQEVPAIKLLMLAAQSRLMVENAQDHQEQRRQHPLQSAQAALQPQQLHQHLLLPTLLLRWVVNHQRSHGSVGSTPVWLTSMALFSAKEALVYWQILADRTADQQQQQQEARSTPPYDRQNQTAAGSSSGAAVNELPGPVLYEYMQLFVECLWGVLQHDSSDSNNAPAGSSSSSSAGSSGGSSGGSSSKGLDGLSNPAPDCFTNVPAFAAAGSTIIISHLLPSVTKLVVGAEHRRNSSNNTMAADGGDNSRGSREACTTSPGLSGGCQWVLLLLRMLATLEHGMRFEARHQATTASSTAGQRWGGAYDDTAPQGPSWIATYMLLSTAGHAMACGLRERARAAAVAAQLKVDEEESKQQGCSLLCWLLETAAPQQQAAVQQQVLGLLTTAIKHSWAVTSGQHLLVRPSAAVFKATVELVWSVLGVLHALQSPATTCSSSSIGVQGSYTTAATSEELCGTITTTTSSSSSNNNSTISSGSSTAGRVVPSYAAMAPWLVLLGRALKHASAFMSDFLQSRYSEDAADSSCHQEQRLQGATGELQTPDAVMEGAVVLVCTLGLTHLPAATMSAAAMFSCDSQRQLPHVGESTTRAVDHVLSSQKQQLAALGQALSQHCSSMGIDVSAIQQSTWALAEATAAAMPWFHGVLGFLERAGLNKEFGKDLLQLPRPQQVLLLQEMGLGPQAATEAANSLRAVTGTFNVQLLAACTALKYNPVIQAFLQQLSATGQALSSLPTAAACNNPSCTSLAGTSEKQGVGGKSCRCAACQLAYYCCRGFQRQHWGVHKPVCKAVQAQKAALPA